MTDKFEARVSLTLSDLYKRVHVERDVENLMLVFHSYQALYVLATEMNALLQDADRWLAEHPDASRELEDLDGI